MLFLRTKSLNISSVAIDNVNAVGEPCKQLTHETIGEQSCLDTIVQSDFDLNFIPTRILTTISRLEMRERGSSGDGILPALEILG